MKGLEVRFVSPQFEKTGELRIRDTADTFARGPSVSWQPARQRRSLRSLLTRPALMKGN